MFDVINYRKDFPIFNHKIQLSSCSQSALHTKVKQAIHRYIDSLEFDGRNWNGWMQACEEARQKFARLINAEPDEVAIVSSVSHAVSAIATSLPQTSKKKRVVMTDADFPCVGHAWLSQDEITISFIEPEGGIIPLDRYGAAVNEDTLLTSISHVAYYNGFKQNLKEIANIVHEKGSYLFVDACQSAGQAVIDVKASNIDFLTAGMQKYLLGIPGLTFLYIKKDIAEQLTPKITGWFGQKNPFSFDVRHVDYAPGAVRFDTGTFPMINGYAASAAFDILLEAGVANIEEYLTELSQFALDYARDLRLIVRSPEDPTMKGSNTAIFTEDASVVESQMAEKGLIVSARSDVVRIAPHFYNTKDDIKTALDALKEMI